MQHDRDILLHHLVQHAYRYRPDEPFRLASGALSPEYLDCRQALSHGIALAALGRLLWDALVPGVQAIGGLTMGADPLAIGTSLAAAHAGQDLCWFSVRKAAKAHGQGRRVEGALEPGMRVTVVDDVVTSGGSTLEAVRCCQDFGLQVVQVLAVVDRQAGGLDAIAAALPAEVPIRALWRKCDIQAAWQVAQR